MTPLKTAALSLALLAAPLQAGADALSPAENAEVDARIRAYILQNPEIILEALEILEERRRVAQAQAESGIIAGAAEALYDDGYSFVAGNPDGDVTIVEFTDYRCGYCKAAHPELRKFLDDDGNVRLVVKEFPILGPESVMAARVAMAGLIVDPARYEALNDALMTHRGGFDEASLFRIAERQGYEEGALRAAMRDPVIEANIRATRALAQQLRIEGTPSFVIGDQVIRGFVRLDQMREIVAETRESQG